MTPQAEAIRRGDARVIARAATAIENGEAAGRELLGELFPHTGRAICAGLTGPAGAGKSTLASRLIGAIRESGRTVGVVAVDPTSPFSGGALLGDRIRMQSHHADPGVFVRSMASRGRLGGVAAATHDLVLLLDAAGYDFVLIETVGVGQDEVAVAGLARVTVVVLTPGMGDDVQALKAGLLEIADVFAINKADCPGAAELEGELHALWSLAPRAARPEPPIVRTVASTGEGTGALLAAIEEAAREPADPREQWETRLCELLRERLLAALPAERLAAAAAEVAARRRDPYTVTEELIRSLYKEASSA